MPSMGRGQINVGGPSEMFTGYDYCTVQYTRDTTSPCSSFPISSPPPLPQRWH